MAMRESKMSTANCSVAYDGPALSEHTMDVQILGPALLAIGDICREANRVINGPESSEIKVNVKATNEGCFDILLEIVQVYDSLGGLIEEKGVANAKTLLEWLGLIAPPSAAGYGLLRFLRWKRGRAILKENQVVEGGAKKYSITVEGENNSVVIIDAPVYALWKDTKVRFAQRRMLGPLNLDGIDEFQVREGATPIEIVKKEEMENGYFDLLPEELDIESIIGRPQTIEAVLMLRAPVFEERRRWQFYYGGASITASIKDLAFNERVFSGGERFGVGDCFWVRMTLTQTLHSNGTIRHTYDIDEIIETKQGPRQLEMLRKDR